MKEIRLKDLLQQHILSDLSETDLDELFLLIDELGQETYDRVLNELQFDHVLNTHKGLSDMQKTRLVKNVLKSIKNDTPRLSIRLLKWVAIFCFIGFASFFLLKNKININDSQLAAVIYNSDEDIWLTQDSLPRLTLVDGRSFSVAISNQELYHQHGFDVQLDTTSALIIQPKQSAAAVEQLCFSTPKGYTSKVRLADGTVVWVNSNTKLYYPTQFSGSTRMVRLEGEAYFEVAHDSKRPFMVNLQTGNVQVLGTSFNIASYPKMQYSITTLLSGKVQMQHADETMILKPNEQALMYAVNKKMAKRTVDVTESISWMKGYYYFNDKTLKEILHTIQNWYDIEEIDLQVDNTELYTGTLKRSKSLKSLLSHLEKLSNLKVELVGRRIVVMK